MEQDLAIGAGLTKIFNRKLYEAKMADGLGKNWLKEESAELTSGRGPLPK